MINAVLDSGSEIVTMPKRVWEGLGLPVQSDHVMTMSNANTSTESTIGVVENLTLDFSAREVYLQVQVVPRANFDLPLGHPFQCLLSAKTDDFPDGSQLITLHNLNSGKAYTIPTRAWTEGCPRCQQKLLCTNHQSIVEVGFWVSMSRRKVGEIHARSLPLYPHLTSCPPFPRLNLLRPRSWTLPHRLSSHHPLRPFCYHPTLMHLLLPISLTPITHSLACKPVAKKVRLVLAPLEEEYRVLRQLPDNPLIILVPLPTHPPEFIPGV